MVSKELMPFSRRHTELNVNDGFCCGVQSCCSSTKTVKATVIGVAQQSYRNE